MKNKIYTYFFLEFCRYFIIILFAVSAIVWTVQAVNFLDLVTDDGHAFNVYFTFSALGIPKIITKLIPFSFLVAIILTLLKLEKDNELIILWTSGLNKIKIVNLILRISILILIIQIILASAITPTFLNISRSVIKNSNLQFFPSLLKEKQFNDTIKNLTIFVEKKNPDGNFEKIFIRDKNRLIKDEGIKSSTIFAKTGYLKKSNNTYNLILKEGTIQKEDNNGKIISIIFDETDLPLSMLSTKSTSAVKIQETSTIYLLSCLGDKNLIPINFLGYKKLFDCQKFKNESSKTVLLSEINRRFGMPFYIPALALIACFVLSSRQENKYSTLNKLVFFVIGFLVLVFAEIFVRYSGISDFYFYLYYFIPVAIIPIAYILLLKNFKYENLKK